MSLPTAKKDISEKPAKNAVTDPTDKAALEADVNRKLKLYGVIQAFRAGRMPDNAQIDETLRWVLDPINSPVDTNNLSAEGNKLIADFRAVIDTARVMVQQKNADELFQQFMNHTSGVEVKGKLAAPDAPLTSEEAKAHGNQGAEHLRTLLQLLLTNAETRKLLSDLTLVSRDLFTIGASKAVEAMRPAPEQMAKVDDAAPSSEFAEHDGDLKTMFKGLGTEIQSGHSNKSDAPNGAASSANVANGSTNGNADVTSPTSAVLTNKHELATSAQDDATGSAPVVTDDAAEKKTFKQRMQSLTGRVPEKHRSAAKEQYSKGKKFLTEEYFPKERRDQFIYRLKKVVVECQSHPKYKDALEWMLQMIESYFGHAKTVAKSSGGQSQSAFKNDPLLQQSVNELRTLLERFANGASVNPIFDAAKVLAKDAQEDAELRAWWDKVDTLARKALLEPGFILSPQFDSQSRQLQEEGHKFFDNKYKTHKDNMFDTVSAFFKSFADDPLNKRFGENWNTLTRDLLFGDDGKLAYKPQLWKDVRSEIVPSLINKIGYVPIPRIEYSDDKLDLVIENLTLQGRNLFPNVMDINISNHIRVSPYSTIKDVQNHTMTLTFAQMQADMRDVAFYFHKKSGFPKIKDHGLADVFLGGSGITATVKVHSQGLDGTGDQMSGRVFKVKSVKVKVDALKFSIRDSKHDLLYKTLRPLATNLIKKQISKGISDGIKSGLEALDEQLVQVRDKMSNPENDPEFSKRKALKEHLGSTKSETASKASKRNSRFSIVPKRNSMILPDVGYEKGWIKRQSERDEAAGQGEGWKSPAFNIVPNGNPASVPVAAQA